MEQVAVRRSTFLMALARGRKDRNNSKATSHDELSPGTGINGDTGERPVVPVDSVKGKKTRVAKRELQDEATKTRRPSTKLNGKEPKMTEKDSQGYPKAKIGNNKAIESEPIDSGDTLFPDADNFSCLLRVDGQNLLELPQSWPEFVVREKKRERLLFISKDQIIDDGLSSIMRILVLRF